MLALHRSSLIACTLALFGLLALFATLGEIKPSADWRWIDIVGEGGTTVLAGVWLVFVLDGRPRGRVTTLLVGGLALIMLATWTDCLDEFYQVDKSQSWDSVLESTLMPAGVLLLTVGLYFWREEQRTFSLQLNKRERLFRDHRAFDRVTQLADAGYLTRQMRIEASRHPGTPAAVVLFDIERFHAINREFGQREGDRALQAVSHLLLLNLRNTDLLCRYAGDRFALLMPATSLAQAERSARQLEHAVESLRHHSLQGDRVLRMSVRSVCAVISGDADLQLRSLNRSIDRGESDSALSHATRPA